MIEETVENRSEKSPFAFFSKDPLSYTVIISITILFIIFLVIPMGYVFFGAFFDNRGRLAFGTFGEIFGDTRFWDPTQQNNRNLDGQLKYISIDRGNKEVGAIITFRGPNFGIILNTLVIGFLTTIFSLILGVTMAFLMARVQFGGKTILSGLLLVPLVLPPFVSGVGYRALLGDSGMINKYFFEPNFDMRIKIQGIFAIVLLESMHYFALIYLNVYSSLMNSDPSLEESAENLGASKSRVARTITLPLAMPGVASGAILVSILAMEDLGTLIIFAGENDPVATRTIPFYIFDEIRSQVGERNPITQKIAIVSSILLIVAIVGFLLIRKFVAMKQYSMVSKGRAGKFREFETNLWQRILIYIFFFLFLFVATIPHVGVILRSLIKPQSLDFTFENYGIIFDPKFDYINNIKNTLYYSFLATFMIIIFATLTAYVANRKKFFGQSAFDLLVTIPIAIPGVVIGIGYISMFSWMHPGSPFPTWFTLNALVYAPTILVISFTVRKFPFAVRAIFAGLQQTDEVLEESAANLGAGKPRIIREIVVPLISLNIVGGALLSLVYTMSEVSTSVILISSPRHFNITRRMAEEVSKIGELAAIGVFLMLLQVVSLFATNVLLKNRADAISGI